MKKEQQRMEGILSDCSHLVVLIFNVLKADILRLIKPTSLVLESISLILPEAVTTITITMKEVTKLRERFVADGKNVLREESFFPTLNTQFLPQIDFDDNGVTLGCSTRREPA